MGQDHDHTEPPSDLELRVKVLESLLVEKGLVDPAALDALIDTYEHKVGPRNGAKVVAKAWCEPDYKNPRGVLQEFGTVLPDETEVRGWDSTAEMRYLVLPMRPVGTDDWNAESLEALVSRNSMIGVEPAKFAESLVTA